MFPRVSYKQHLVSTSSQQSRMQKLATQNYHAIERHSVLSQLQPCCEWVRNLLQLSQQRKCFVDHFAAWCLEYYADFYENGY